MLIFVHRASLYNLVNKANLIHNFSWYIYLFSLHISGNYVPIFKRNNCIYATLGICHSVWMTVWSAGWNRQTRQSSTQKDKYLLSHRYSYFSWWWAHSCPKHIEKRNKYTNKNCSPSWLYLQKYFWISFPCVFIFQTQRYKLSLNKIRSKHKINQEKREDGFRYVTCDRR